MTTYESKRVSMVKATDLLAATWVELVLVPKCVVGGGRKAIWPKLFLCISKNPTHFVRQSSHPSP